MPKVLVSVTQEDIDAGMPKSPCRCPIALAFRRQGLYPRIKAKTALFDRHGREHRRPLPDEARDFIAAFDYAGPVQPFSFEIEIPKGLVAAHPQEVQEEAQ